MENLDTLHIGGDASVGRNVAVGGRATVQGDVVIKHNLKVEGRLDAPNKTDANKGVFETVEALRLEYPKPANGWYALVGEDLYAGKNGAWVLVQEGMEIATDGTRVWSGIKGADGISPKVNIPEIQVQGEHTIQITDAEHDEEHPLTFTVKDGKDGKDAVNPFKGKLGTLAALNAAYPSPVAGEYAVVTVSGTDYVFRCGTDGVWPDSSTEVYDPSSNPVFGSGEELLQTGIDRTVLKNPASNALAKAGDVMKLAAKLEGVTATEDKATPTNTGTTGTFIKPDNTTGSGTGWQWGEFALGNAKTVRFVALDYKTSTTPSGGWLFLDGSNNILKSAAYTHTAQATTKVELVVAVPEGATTFKTNIAGGELTGNFYCYLQSGESVKDMVDTFKDELYGYSDDSVVSETDYKDDITASIILSIGKDSNDILCVKRSTTALYRAGKITNAHFKEIKEEFAKLHVDGYYVAGTSRTGSLIFTKKDLTELTAGTYYYQDLKDAGYLCDGDTETDFIHRFAGKGTQSGANGYDYEIPKDANYVYFQYKNIISGTNVNLYPISIVPFSEKHAGKLDNLPTGGTVEVIDNLNSEDPEAALSAKQGMVIGGELEKQYKVKQIVFYKKPTYGISSTGNNWGSDTTYAHAIVPVKTGEIYKIENYGSNDNIRYAFLTSDECEAGAAMPLVDGTSIKTVNAGEIVTFTIPEGCTYITFMCNKPTGTGTYYSRLYKVLHISDKEITPFDEDYIEAYTLGMPINAVDYHDLWDDLVDEGIVQRSEATYMSYDSETQKYPLYTYHIRCHRDWMGYGNNSQYRVGQNTDFTNPLYRRKKVMITAGIHGCERLTPNTFLKWVKKHINDDIFAEFDFVIIPLCNPYGYSNTLVTSGGNVADFSKINADTFPSGYSIIENTDTKNRGLRRTYGWIDINRDFYDTGGFQTEEAQYIRDVWVAEQPDMVIDFHQDLNSGDTHKKCGFANVGSNPGLTSEEFLEMKRKLYTLIDKAGYATDKYVNMYFDAASKKQQTFCWYGANPNAAPSTDPPTQGVWKAFATGSSKINTLYRDHVSRYAFTFETDIYCNQLSGSTITPNNGIAKMFGYIFMSNFLKYILDIFKLDEPRLDTPTEEPSDDEDEGEE